MSKKYKAWLYDVKTKYRMFEFYRHVQLEDHYKYPVG